MTCPLILAESASLDRFIRVTELLMDTTALPAFVGLLVLWRHGFRAPGAGVARLLGLVSVLLAGGLGGFLWRQEAIWEWYRVPGACGLAGALVWALGLARWASLSVLARA